MANFACASCVLHSTAGHGAITVPAGGTVSLAGGSIDLGCTDVTVAGNLQVGSALITTVRNVTIQAGAPPDGTLDGGSGSITLAGNWSNSGTFNSGSSSVFFVDNPGCSASSTIGGGTTFFNLSLVSNLGKVYTFVPGATQTILQALTIQGTLANPIQITSGVAGNPGFTNLAPGGSQNISHLGVSDNWAVGQALAPLSTNEGGSGNASGWFGNAAILATAIPTIGTAGIALLALILAGFTAFFAPYRTRIHRKEQ